MKIEGQLANGHYLISMSETEVTSLAGYRQSWDVPKELRPSHDSRTGFKLGIEIKVTKAFEQNYRMFEKEKEVRNAAGMLRTLADMMEAAGPSEIIPPETNESEGARKPC